jgi:hypothetical protein
VAGVERLEPFGNPEQLGPLTGDRRTMMLSEVGYDQSEHDTRIKAIQVSSIAEAIHALVKVYHDLYEIDAYEINCGMCEDFANDVVDLIPGAIAEWGDGFTNEQDDSDHYAYHCIVLYRGRFYDSQHPDGVDNFRNISAFA